MRTGHIVDSMKARLVWTALLLCPASALAAPKMSIVFSKQPITSTKPEPGNPALATTFQLGDPIYARIYTSNGASIKSHQSTPGNPVAFHLNYKDIDGRDYNDYSKLVLDDAGLQQSYADVDVFPEGAQRQKLKSQMDRDVELSTRFVELLTIAVDKGSASVNVAFDLGNWGSATFTVQCSKAGLAKAKELAQKALLGHIESVRMERAARKDKKLEKQMAKIAATSERTGGGKVLRVVITSNDWQVERNARRQIIERYMFTQVAFKRGDPKICFLETARFAQQHDGRRYLALAIPGTSIDATKKILCKNVGN